MSEHSIPTGVIATFCNICKGQILQFTLLFLSSLHIADYVMILETLQSAYVVKKTLLYIYSLCYRWWHWNILLSITMLAEWVHIIFILDLHLCDALCSGLHISLTSASLTTYLPWWRTWLTTGYSHSTLCLLVITIK